MTRLKSFKGCRSEAQLLALMFQSLYRHHEELDAEQDDYYEESCSKLARENMIMGRRHPVKLSHGPVSFDVVWSAFCTFYTLAYASNVTSCQMGLIGRTESLFLWGT